MGNSISPHIENAKKTGVCSLKAMKLKELPPEINQLPKSLRTLDLSDNQLKEVTAVVGKFVMLKSLFINNNKLQLISFDLAKLLKLESLSLSFNTLSKFEFSGEKLKHLKTVNLSNNKLKSFPGCLSQLPNVDVIDVSNNQFTGLPDSIGSLKVIELNLNNNRLNKLSNELSRCERLKVLRVESNCLPVEAFTVDILMKSQISVLANDGNLFGMKEFQDLEGYDQYIARYAAGKKKL